MWRLHVEILADNSKDHGATIVVRCLWNARLYFRHVQDLLVCDILNNEKLTSPFRPPPPPSNVVVVVVNAFACVIT